MKRNEEKYRYLTAILCIAALMISGCKTQRIAPGNSERDRGNGTVGMISILENKTHGFKTMKAKKMEVEYELNGIKDRMKGSIAIYRDSLIALSLVPALGYEVVRIICTKDSVMVINRPEKIYQVSSFAEYQRKYGIPMEFKDIQAILANEVFYFKDGYNDRIYEKKLTTRKENNLLIVDALRDGKKITNQGIEIDKEGKKLESIFVIDHEQKIHLRIEYQDFEGEEKWLFPKKIKVDLIESNKTIRVEVKYGQIIFDESIRVEFAVPEQYTRDDI